ncbi:unnamed protein product [Symbiodinium sp. CCMP2592]|nr:unnamed protein product [Symbiodinium sp. CCMP2592]
MHCKEKNTGAAAGGGEEAVQEGLHEPKRKEKHTGAATGRSEEAAEGGIAWAEATGERIQLETWIVAPFVISRPDLHLASRRRNDATKVGNCTCLTEKPKEPGRRTYEVFLHDRPLGCAQRRMAHPNCDRPKRRSCRKRDCVARGDRWANPAASLDNGSVCDQPSSHAARIAEVLCSGPCQGNANPHNKTVRRNDATKVGNCTCLTEKPKEPGRRTYEVFLQDRPCGCAQRSMAHPYCDRPKRRSCEGRECVGKGDRWANPTASLDDGFVCDQPPSHASRIADVLCSGPCQGKANPHKKTVRQNDATKVGNCTCLAEKPKEPGRRTYEVFLQDRPLGCAQRSMAHPHCGRPKRRSCRRRDCVGKGDRWANPAASLDDGSVCDQTAMQPCISHRGHVFSGLVKAMRTSTTKP